MKKVVIAVDETECSKSVVSVFRNMVRRPEVAILVHVQRLEGNSLMIDMLGEAEMSTLRESLKGTEHKEALDRKSEKILSYYKKEMENDGTTVKTVTREGAPPEEILKVAREECADLIITGQTSKSILERLLRGSVSRDMQKKSPVPVLVAKNAMCREKSLNRGSRETLKRQEWVEAKMG